jgi:hypothetical protein
MGWSAVAEQAKKVVEENTGGLSARTRTILKKAYQDSEPTAEERSRAAQQAVANLHEPHVAHSSPRYERVEHGPHYSTFELKI